MLERIALYPPIFAGVFVANIWVETAVSPFAVTRSLAIAVSLAILTEFLAWLVVRDGGKAGLVGFGFVIVAIGARSWLFLPLVGLVVVALALWRPTKRPLPRLARVTAALNLFSLILLAVVVSKVIVGGRIDQIARDLDQGGPLPSAAEAAPDPARPDLYFVLLDGYPGPEFLERNFGDDNHAFLDDLRNRGFDVVKESRSNYTATMLTLASMFNMRYLDHIDAIRPVLQGMTERQPAFRHVISDNAVFKRLHDLGYTTVFANAGFEDIAMRNADIYLDAGEMNEFEIILARLTVAEPIIEALAPAFVGDQQRSRVRSNLHYAIEAAAAGIDTPRAVFIHVPSPHAPVAFGPSGEPQPVRFSRIYEYVTETPEQRADLGRRYHEQLSFLNREVTQTVDQMIAAIADRPTVVVLFSDHGSLTNLDPDREMDKLERVSDLIAVRAPGRPDLVPDGTSLVNLWPRILNAYLGTELPIVPDHSYVSFATHPFDFEEVR
jgi:hypothetical protein